MSAGGSPPERFASDWLSLREPVDHRSRSDALADELAAWCRTRGTAGAGGEHRPDDAAVLRVVDLGAGTGSNLRYLAPRLPGPQAWTLVDHDAGLLARAAETSLHGTLVASGPSGGEPVRVTPVHASLADPEGRLSPEVARALAEADVVTASALLDLLSPAVLSALVDAVTRAGAAALFTLSYDGTITWSPEDPDDALVRDAQNAHQRRDKGAGPALGPTAGHTAKAAFQARGHTTRTAPSPWRLGPPDRALVHELVAGWASAATEQRPASETAIADWARRRATTADGHDFELVVGHLDLLTLPP